MAWKENATGNVSKCAFHFLNIKGYSFGSFKEVGKKYCQVHYSKRVSKRKTSGKKAHFEPVRFLLSVLLLLSKWCMKETCLHVHCYMQEPSLEGIPVHCVLREMPCSNVSLFLVLLFKLNRYIKLTWAVGTQVIASWGLQQVTETFLKWCHDFL